MNASAPSSATTDNRTHDRRRRPLLTFCLFYYALAIISGVRSALVVTSAALTDDVLPVALVICLCSWAIADSRERQQPIARSLRIWFYWLAPIVVPGYVLGTRGWLGLAWMAFHIVAWFALAAAVMHLVGYLYWGNAWWQSFQVQ